MNPLTETISISRINSGNDITNHITNHNVNPSNAMEVDLTNEVEGIKLSEEVDNVIKVEESVGHREVIVVPNHTDKMSIIGKYAINNYQGSIIVASLF